MAKKRKRIIQKTKPTKTYKKIKSSIKKANKITKPKKVKVLKGKAHKIANIGKTHKKASRIVERKIKSTAKKVVRKAIRRTRKEVKKGLLKQAKIKKLYNGISKIDLDTATIPELKLYIKQGVKLVNTATPTMNRASLKALKKAIDRYGESKEGLSSVISGDKLALQEKAKVVEALIEGDGVSAVAHIIKDIATDRAYKTFKKETYESFKKGAHGMILEDLTKEEYVDLVTEAGRIESIIGEYYNNTESDFNLMYTLGKYGKEYGYKTIGNIITSKYQQALSEGINTAEDMDDYLMNAIKEVINDGNI